MSSPERQLPLTLRRLLREHRGLITQQQALDAGLGPHVLAFWARAGVLQRAQRGVYRHPGVEPFTHQELLELALRVPTGIVCLLSAMDFHELSTLVPAEVHLAIPQRARRPKLEYPPVRFHNFSDNVYGYGIEVHGVGLGTVRVYSAEKTLADLLRFRNRYGLNLFLESLKTYLGRGGYSVGQLLEAARVCGVERSMRDYATTVLA